MAEPFGWWGRLPVFTNGYKPLNRWTELGEHREWHERQLEDALRAANEKHAEVPKIIPETGFYVQALRIRSNELRSGVLICEETENLTYPNKRKPAGIFAGATITGPLGALGTEENVFFELFDEAAAVLPAKWEEHLKWRRQRHWKPVPEWLVTLRAEERQNRRRRAVANDSPQ